MKTKLIVLIGATALATISPLLWADQLAGGDQPDRDRDAAQSHQLPRLGDLRRADRIIGSDINDDQGQKLGKVKDLALDLMNGRIVEVIVLTGGLMDHKVVAIPPASFTFDNQPNQLRLNVTRDQLKDIQEFRLSQWDESTDIARIAEVYQRFGAEPYFKDNQPPPIKANDHAQVSHYYAFNGNNALPHLGYVARASALMDTTALSMENEKLGRVEDFIVDLPAGRVVEVVLGLGSYLHPSSGLTAVPPQAFHWNADKTALTLDSSLGMLKAAPSFTPGHWELASEPERIRDAYTLYHVEPYFGLGVDTGAQNVRERSESAVPTVEQGNNADLKVTEEIHKDVMARENLSLDVQDLKIITLDGKVTLLGSVATEDEKRQLGELAAKTVPADKVDNRLQVRGIPNLPAIPPSDLH